MKNENNQKCDPCEQQFENNVDKMVNDVEGYTSSDHKTREKEVDGAFGSKAQGQDNKNGQSYGNDRNSGSMGQDQKTQSYGSNGTGSMSQGQNSQKGQSYGTGSKMQGQNETWRQNTSSNDPKSGQQYGSDKSSGTAPQGQTDQWKGNNNPIDRHEHTNEGDYARNTKTEGR